MKSKEKAFCLTLVFAFFIWMVYLSTAILTPFICSICISYLLNPVVTRFHKNHDMTRLRATLLILALFCAIFISISLIILPTIYTQLLALIDALPHYFKVFTTSVYPKVADMLNGLGLEIDKQFSHIADQQKVTSNLVVISKNMFHNALNSWSGIMNILSLLFITPFLIFYILNDWDTIVKKISAYLPKRKTSPVRKALREIHDTLSSYIRGQINVCLILGAFYSILLSFAGLNFGFVIGFITGILSFIPYVGMFMGVTLAIIVSLFQWGFDVSQLLAIGAVFFAGQILEGNFLTPKFVGDEIGLHPAWMIFGLFFFGNLFGFLGVLLGIPLTAIFTVILKHLSIEYKRRF